MTRKFTKKLREKIVADYIAKHGHFDPRGFLREVRNSNGSHPAWPWFEWNDGKAAEEYRVEQAREFVQGLTISFQVETIERSVPTIKTKEFPAYVSPLDGRRDGGGYLAVDPENPAHLNEIERQGLIMLEAWMKRFKDTVETNGVSCVGIQAVVDQLVSKHRPEKEEAA